MNNSLLSDKEYVSVIKNTIKRITFQYTDFDALPSDADNSFDTFIKNQSQLSLQTLPLNINPELLFKTYGATGVAVHALPTTPWI